MKKSLYLASAVALALGFTACEDTDYTDWVMPEGYTQDAVAEKVGLTASPATTATDYIDFASLEGETVKVLNVSLSADYDATYELVFADGTVVALDKEGCANVDELQAAVVKQFGKAPEVRETTADLVATINVDGAGVKATVGGVTFYSKPDAPIIESAYYLTGNINGWDNTNTDFCLTNGGADVYENPVFTLTFSADLIPEGTETIEFKVTPESGLGGDWSGCLCADETEGKFVDKNAGGNFAVPVVADAMFYCVTFNMLEMTWSMEAFNFAEYIYEIGDESGWGTAHALRSPAFDGKYKGYYYLDGEFKFKPNADNWDGDWECTGEGIIGEGGNNCPAPEAGFYEINVDLTTMTYSLTPITQIGLIGDFNSWGGDVDLTYNTQSGAWEATGVELKKGGVKFRANADWAINWGGDLDGLTQDGANISLNAGTYDISLTLSTEGNHKAVFTETSGAGASWSDFVYYAGDYNGWSTDASPLAHQGAGYYEGYYYIKAVDNENTWGFKIVDGNWYGDGGNGTLSADGGNINPGEAGFYQINADMDKMTYSITPMTIGLIGDATANGWDGDTAMEFNTESGAWEWSGSLAAGTFKFRANGGWDINWGGDLNNLAKGGDNIAVEAGSYKVSFKPNCDGKATATVVAQ